MREDIKTIITQGKLNFNENIEYIIYEDNFNDNNKFVFMNVSDNAGNTVNHCFYSYELVDMLKALNNTDIEKIKEINKDIGRAVQSFYNHCFINNDIIKKVCQVLDITLSEHEKELYNQDFSDTKDNLFSFTEKTFNNNWFYALGDIQAFNDETTKDDIIRSIIQYYMKIFINSCIECEYNWERLEEMYD